MKRVLGSLYLAVFMFGAYALSTPVQSGSTAVLGESKVCGSCRAKDSAPKQVAKKAQKQKKVSK